MLSWDPRDGSDVAKMDRVAHFVRNSSGQRFRNVADHVFSSKLRFLFPIIILGALKAYGAVWTYHKFILNNVFQTRWMSIFNAPLEPRWLYLFVAWDTSWYVGLAHFYTVGHTFFPGYPFLIKSFGSLIGNYWMAAIFLSIVLGFALLPLFQGIAESYMSKGEALGSTLIMGVFPYVFVYTTVAYSESLFLFSVLAAWYCYLKGRLYSASLFAVVATFTKTYGIIIVLPMLLGVIAHRRWKKIPLALAPVILVGAFVFLFRDQSLMERMILEINTATWSVSRGGTGYFWMRDFVTPIFSVDRPIVFFDYWHAFALVFIVLSGGLAIYSAKTDWRLGVYSTSMYMVIIFFGFINGLIRYLSFVFPVWLIFRTRNPLVLLPLTFLFYVHSLILWQQFLCSPLPL